MESLSSKYSQGTRRVLFSCGSGGSGVLLQKDCEDLSSAKPIFFEKSELQHSLALISEYTNADWKNISVGNVRALGITDEGETYEWGEIETGFASDVKSMARLATKQTFFTLFE